MLVIGHTADIQVKTRTNNLFKSTLKTLKDIEAWVIKDKIDILIIAGDLTEYAEPNESERKLINNWLGRLLNIKSLKEIVIMAGNHDLLKERKQTEASVGHNPINSFVEMLENIDQAKRDKIVYVQWSQIYLSSISDKIQYVGYSLEDDVSTDWLSGENVHVFGSGRFNICMYHGMIREYVDSVKLPLRKDILNSLHTLDIFPPNSLIAAGDIHQNLTFEGLSNQLFIYPGAPMQHTFGEGEYITISDTYKITKAPKFVTKYTIDDSQPVIELSNIKIDHIQLSGNVRYYTIELDTKQPIETILELLSANPIESGLEQTLIKVKTSPIFIQHEMTINQAITDSLTISGGRIDIAFEYDKVFKSSSTISQVENQAIQEIIEEKHKENIDNNNSVLTGTEIILSSENIDDLILSDRQIVKLFDSVLANQMKMVDADISEEVKADILALFETQLALCLDSSSKRYDLQLDGIETTGFMGIGPNKIDLNIPGIVKILGTNGIGKTTLFNMLRWAVNDEVYQGMSKASVTKNSLLVFHKKRIDIDYVEVCLKFRANNIPIIAKRTAKRIWKNNVTDEQKASLNWKEYVSNVERSFTLEIAKNIEGTPNQILSGDQANKTIMLWFGQVLDTILFMNHSRIETLLKTNSDKLNEMILNFIGVDYLKKLEENVPAVKLELNNVGKPKLTKDVIQTNIVESGKDIELLETRIQDINTLTESIDTQILTKTGEQSILNSQLLDLGNVPKLIEEATIEASELKLTIDNFEVKEKLPRVPFTEVQPEMDKTKTDEQEKIMSDNKASIVANNEEIVKISENKDSKATELFVYINSIVDDKSKLILLRENQITQHDALKTINWDKIGEYIDSTLNNLKTQQDNKATELQKMLNDLNTLNTNIESNEITINSGVCSACGKAFDDTPEQKQHLIDLKQKIESDRLLVIEVLASINKHKEGTTKIDEFKNKFDTYRDLFLRKAEKQLFEFALIWKPCKEFVDIIDDINDSIQLAKSKISEFEESKSNWLILLQQLNLGQYPDFTKTALLSEEYLEVKVLFENLKTFDVKIQEKTELNTQAELAIRTATNIIVEIIQAHNKKLTDYQTLQNANITENAKIDADNQLVEIHNNTKVQKELEYAKITVNINKLNDVSLPVYTATAEKYDLVSKELETLNVELKANQTSFNSLKFDLIKANQRNKEALLDYEQFLKYHKNQLISKIYSKIIGEGFKDIVFEYYRTFLNTTLNHLLVDVNFGLFWNSDSELYMVDSKHGICSYQPVQQSSGMETTFLGLALVYTMHLLNVKNSISHIFIDEISGTLNKGKELSYNAENYQELLVLILSKFKNKSIFIVDHNIDNLFETMTYEVIPNNEGTGSTFILK